MYIISYKGSQQTNWYVCNFSDTYRTMYTYVRSDAFTFYLKEDAETHLKELLKKHSINNSKNKRPQFYIEEI